jgi:CheY-like chemotaxis protein
MDKTEKLVFMLLVDDDDKFLTSTTSQELGYDIPIQFLSNAPELFAALKEQTPSIILIDYNMTPDSGVEILKQLKSDERYQSIPVIILTDSPQWHYHAQCYRHGASTVIKKPDTSQMTTEKISTFFHYWVNIAETL